MIGCAAINSYCSVCGNPSALWYATSCTCSARDGAFQHLAVEAIDIHGNLKPSQCVRIVPESVD